MTEESIQAVLLTAGERTRMRPLSASVPKPMLPVADRPLAAHAADAVALAGASELLVVVGYGADVVREYFGTEYAGIPVSYAVQHERAGTADAVRTVRNQLSGSFVVLNGDNLYDPETVRALFADGPAVGAHHVAHPSRYGVLSTEGDTVTGVVDKPTDPPTTLANTGAYRFPREASEWLDVPASERGEHDITDVLARIVDEYDVRYATMDRWLDVGRPWELLEANEWKLAELDRDVEGEVHDDADLRGDVVVEDGAVVDAGVVVEGPALIRSGARVGPNAYVRGTTLLAEDAHVGHGVEIKNSVIGRGTHVAHLSYVGDSVLGQHVNVGGPTSPTSVTTTLT